MMEEVPDMDDQPNVSENADEDAASETGTDDSGLVMALDQDSTENREENPSVNSCAVNLNPAVKTSERTRSTISEDKAAVRRPHLNHFNSFHLTYFIIIYSILFISLYYCRFHRC